MKIKRWNILVYVLLFAVLSLGGEVIKLWTDYFWFEEVGFTSVFARSLGTQSILWIFTAVLTASMLLLNAKVAGRMSRRPFVVIGPDVTVSSPLPIPQVSELKPLLRSFLFGFIALAALMAANWAADQWESALKFLNGLPFGMDDPIFHRDIGFYVFRLPFLKVIFSLALSLLICSFLIVIAIYLVNARIYFSPRGIQVSDHAKIHLAVLGGFLAMLLAFYFQIRMFDLLSIQRALAPGAGYAGIHASLPGLKILRFVAVLSAILLWISPGFLDWKLIFGSILLLLLGALLARFYTEAVQKFQVAPNEIARETPYIEQSIRYTRLAYGLNGIQELEFNPQENLTAEALKKNDLTIKNIRLWEHRPLLTSYGQLQEIRTYYDFLDADNDRYWIGGEVRQVMLSVRELVPESLPSRIWMNEHLTYTHGYGLCLGPVNRISPEGLPEFFIKDIPPKSTIADLAVTRPQIYYGEARAGYAIVKTRAKEFDYPSGEENVYTTYEGSGGVPVRNFFRRLLLAVCFGEMKILFSRDIGSDSRFLFYRNVRERLSKAAPFIRFEADPYAVITKEGRIVWFVDGYTVTDHYPYSEDFGDINYVRNSVKATVDAYDGTIRFYIADPNDPIIRTYSKIFPGVFQPLERMPEDLRSHIRYPQTLMNIQAKIYALYHMTDPQVFYNKEDLWKIPLRTQGGGAQPMEPYYTIMKLAGLGEKEEFILMVPFTPSKKENMIAWMAARCDAPNYGKLLVYNFPKQKLVYGPQQIESRIDQDAEISKLLSLWNQGGSRVLRGSLLVVPVDQSLLCVQPLYLEATNGGLPELKRVIVAYGNAIAMEENLELSLARIFGGKPGRGAMDAPASASHDLKKSIKEASDHFERAQSALRRGDWASYGEEMARVRKILKDLSE